MRPWFVYILYSSKTQKYYTGSTDNLIERLKHHNGGHTPSTKAGSPEWEIVYTESEIIPGGTKNYSHECCRRS